VPEVDTARQDTAATLPRAGFNWRGWRNRLIARPGFQRWAARTPVVRRIVRAEGQALFDLVSGFVYSQVLAALVELDLLATLRDSPARPGQLSARCRIAPDRMAMLLQAGAALGLLDRLSDGRFQTARKGAALLGVPGLPQMIRHHAVFYRDMTDPLALLRGEGETELAQFWPYVLGAHGDVPADVAASYSKLMADSQVLVAEDTLRQVDLRGSRHLLDVGGGTGAFLAAVGAEHPTVRMTLFDLPAVASGAAARFAAAGLQQRVAIRTGSFRADPLPGGADAVSLVRVLYDHADDTVADLLAKVHATLPPGGRLIVSEPMSGGSRPNPAGDAYFAFYTAAMGTGRARSQNQIAGLISAAGFTRIRCPRPFRPFVTSTVTAEKPLK
jgi:demethylspheroidene O-methyltransferase